MDFCARSKFMHRAATILPVVNELLGGSLPEDKRFLSLCDRQYDRSGGTEYSELHQLIVEGVISESQYLGFRIGQDNDEVIRRNKQTWSEAEFRGARLETEITKSHNPGVIFFDACAKETLVFKSLQTLLSTHAVRLHRPIIIVNVAVSGTRTGTSYGDDAIEFERIKNRYKYLNGYTLWIPEAWKKNANFNGVGYDYKSTNRKYLTFVLVHTDTLAQRKKTMKTKNNTLKSLAYLLLSSEAELSNEQISTITGLGIGSIRAYKAHVTMGNAPAVSLDDILV